MDYNNLEYNNNFEHYHKRVSEIKERFALRTKVTNSKKHKYLVDGGCKLGMK
jgi:hypothetical protein